MLTAHIMQKTAEVMDLGQKISSHFDNCIFTLEATYMCLFEEEELLCTNLNKSVPGVKYGHVVGSDFALMADGNIIQNLHVTLQLWKSHIVSSILNFGGVLLKQRVPN